MKVPISIPCKARGGKVVELVAPRHVVELVALRRVAPRAAAQRWGWLARFRSLNAEHVFSVVAAGETPDTTLSTYNADEVVAARQHPTSKKAGCARIDIPADALLFRTTRISKEFVNY